MSVGKGNRPEVPSARRWKADDLRKLTINASNVIPQHGLRADHRILGYDLWDMWPIEHEDGTLPRFDGRAFWMVLAAPAGQDPDDRHAIARIHLASERDGLWTLLQPLFPDGFTPGNREWSGSAILDKTGRLVTYFTAAGRRGEDGPSFEQRLFEARCDFDPIGPAISNWSKPVESFVADGRQYLVANQTEGRSGEISGFRDPGFFRDPEDGRAFLFFTGSSAISAPRWNGVIGVAQNLDPEAGKWSLLPPVLTADGLNNELERPHMRRIDGRYYLFWSTQNKVFAPDGPAGPTGLYGAVAPTPLGPFTLLNDSGLIASVPATAPAQEYSWWVLDDLKVIGFADFPGVEDMAILDDARSRRHYFAGYPAPFFQLGVDGDRAWVKAD